jgi:hypothetical protein
MTYRSPGPLHRLVAGGQRRRHQRLQVTAQLAQFFLDAGMDMLEVMADKMLIQIVVAVTSSDGV